VFLPLPTGALALAAGTPLAVRWRCEYASHPRFPDYVVDVATPAGEQRLVSRHGPDPAGSTALHRQLLAALPASDGPAIGALRAALAAALPAASVPQAWVFLPALPLNTNGKLDRAALPAPGTGRPPLAVPFAPPADATERRLAAVWEAVLGLAGLGRDDDFFDLGGDSILAVQLVTAVARDLDAVVPLAALFDAPTIAGMARALAAGPAPGAGARDRGEL
jgi:acyl carrier protein